MAECNKADEVDEGVQHQLSESDSDESEEGGDKFVMGKLNSVP